MKTDMNILVWRGGGGGIYENFWNLLINSRLHPSIYETHCLTMRQLQTERLKGEVFH